MVESIRVLHVDDEEAFAEMAAEYLQREHDALTVVAETSGEAGLERLDAESFDCVVSDYDMPRMNGLEFLDAVREDYPDLPFILFTGKGSEEIASEAISRGVTDYLQKRTSGEQYTVLANRITNAVGQYRAEREVEQTRERFSKLVERSPDVVSIIDPDGTYRYVAPSIEEVLGYDPDELLGTNALDLVHPDDYDCAVTELSKVSDEPGGERTADVKVEAADGGTRVLEVKGRNLLEEPSVEGIVLNIRDITERVELRNRLREHADALRRLYEISADVDLGFETKATRLLEVGSDHLGLSTGYVARVDGDTLRAVAATGDHDLVEAGAEAPLSRTYCRRPVESGDLHVVTDAEAEGWTDDPAYETFGFRCYLGAPIVVDGDVYGTFCFADTEPHDGDVPETARSLVSLLAQWAGYELLHERQVEKLRGVETRLDLALEATGAYMWDWDIDTETIQRHGSVERLLGFEPGELGTDLEAITSRIHPDYREAAHDAYRRALEDAEPYRVEYPIRTADGEYLWVQDQGQVQTDDAGEPERIVGTVEDITEHKERERELRHQNERLEEFASIVSHDLRNPLQVAQGYVDEIQGNEEAVEKVATSLERMNQIVEDMLTMARKGQNVEETEAVSLASFAEECWEHVDTGDATLVVEDDTRLQADPSRFRNLLENLFRNSVEHGSTGGRTDSADAVVIWVGGFDGGFYVEDDGPGIPEDDRSAVFDPGFSTSDHSTGFGLNIVEEIAEAHGWAVRVTDGRQGGARFEFRTVTE